MKKLFIVMMAMAMVVGFYGYLYASGSGAGLKNSPHDFSAAANTWNHRTGEMCRVCHVPHDHGRTLATQAALGTSGLLWNRTLSVVDYTLYSSPTLTGAIGQPTGTAKMCLGCHDGTVALQAFDSGGVGTTYIQNIDADYRVPSIDNGTNLKGTHPISIVYDESDLGLVGILGTAIGGETLANVLDGGKVQCSSCHDVHDSPGESVNGTHLLRVQNNDTANPSGLCVVCHAK